MRRGRWSKVLALLAALMVVAAACGDDDDDDDSGGASTDTTAASTEEGGTTDTTAGSEGGGGEAAAGLTRGITDTTIRVGGLAQLDYFPGMAEGARARFERANAEGGVHGRTIDFIGIENDGSDAAQNLEVARAQVENEEVFALITTSAVLLPGTTDYLAENQVPFFGWGFMPGFCEPNQWGFGFNGCVSGFAFGVPGAQLNASLIDPVAVELGVEPDEFTVAILNSDDDTGRAGSAQYHELWAEDQILYEDAVPTGGTVTDYSVWVDGVMSADPDAVIVSTDFAAALGLKASLAAAGYDGLMVDYTTYIPGLLTDANVAAALEGGYSNAQFPPSEDGGEATAQILADLEAAGEQPFVTQGASIGWWSADLLLAMLEAVGPELDTATFHAVAEAGFTYAPPYEGSLGSISWPQSWTDVSPCSALVKVEDGAFVSAVPFACYGLLPPPG